MVSKQKIPINATYSGRLPSAFHLDLLLKMTRANSSILILRCYGAKKKTWKCKACLGTDSNLVFGRLRWRFCDRDFLDLDRKPKISVTVLVCRLQKRQIHQKQKWSMAFCCSCFRVQMHKPLVHDSPRASIYHQGTKASLLELRRFMTLGIFG